MPAMVCVHTLVILVAFGCTSASDTCDDTSLLQGILPSRHVSKHRDKKTEPETFTHLAAELGQPGQTPNHRHLVETELSDEALHELSGEFNEYTARYKELRQIPETSNGQQQRLALLQELEERADELASDFNQLAGLETELGEMEMEASDVEGTPSLLETHTKDGGSSGSWRRRRRRWFEAVVATVVEAVDEVQDTVGEVIDAVQTIDGEDDGFVDSIIDDVQDVFDVTQSTTTTTTTTTTHEQQSSGWCASGLPSDDFSLCCPASCSTCGVGCASASDMKCPNNHEDRLYRSPTSGSSDITVQECYDLCESTDSCAFMSFGVYSGGNVCMGCTSFDTAEADSGFTLYDMSEWDRAGLSCCAIPIEESGVECASGSDVECLLPCNGGTLSGDGEYCCDGRCGYGNCNENPLVCDCEEADYCNCADLCNAHSLASTDAWGQPCEDRFSDYCTLSP